MRAVIAIALVATMGGAEIERAQQVARSRESEREQFHRRYVFDLKGDTVIQIEVITEFRRLVLTTEEHLRLGDQMFSRGVREAEAAMAPTRGLVTFRSKLRFHPLNTYADVPPVQDCTRPRGVNGRVYHVLTADADRHPGRRRSLAAVQGRRWKEGCRAAWSDTAGGHSGSARRPRQPAPGSGARGPRTRPRTR